MENALLAALRDKAFRSDVGQGVLDAINRGVVAQALGGPVDMGNLVANALRAGVGYVGHKTGILSADQMPQLVDKPVGGSEWFGDQMQRAGMVSGKRNALAEALAGGALAPAAGAALAQRAPQIANAFVRMEQNAAAPRTLNPQAGMIVWHGSPHKFDRFDSSKIGSGEGNQAYGRGIYLAESKIVSDGYAGSLSKPKAYFKVKPVSEIEKRLKMAADNVVYGMDYRTGGRSQALSEWYRKVTQPELVFDYSRLPEKTYIRAPNGQVYASDKYHELSRAQIDERIALRDAALRLGEPSAVDSGHLYKVDLPDEAIARMLDWDKPLSQQAPAVRAAIGKTKEMLPPNAMDDIGGDLSMLYGNGVGADSFLGAMNSLRPNLGEELLRRAGVPGVRYLDGGSRGTGTGTSNFVVFPGEESILKILERNGVPLK